jgi:glycosyltransferase involved in cell wall biosynthesis
MSRIALGLVTNGSAGWKTVRERWESDLADCMPGLHHIEDHFRPFGAMSERYGARSVVMALAGRAAARAALKAGAKVVLLSTLQNAPFVPLRKGVAYVVYGDCTTAQLAQVYGGRALGFPGSLVVKRIRRLVDHGAYFLCMSDWYRRALRQEFSIPEDRLALLPFYVDAEKWKPSEEMRPRARKRALFIGGDLVRKGGDVVYELARREEFRQVDFHIVSDNAADGPANLHPHRGLKADSAELVRLVASCDLMLAPTRADASPIAVLEAAACALPCIATRVGGMSEIVMDGVTGSLLAQPRMELFAAELSAYLANPRMMALRGANARQFVERSFSKGAHMAALRRAITQASAEAHYQQCA